MYPWLTSYLHPRRVVVKTLINEETPGESQGLTVGEVLVIVGVLHGVAMGGNKEFGNTCLAIANKLQRLAASTVSHVNDRPGCEI